MEREPYICVVMPVSSMPRQQSISDMLVQGASNVGCKTPKVAWSIVSMFGAVFHIMSAGQSRGSSRGCVEFYHGDDDSTSLVDCTAMRIMVELSSRVDPVRARQDLRNLFTAMEDEKYRPSPASGKKAAVLLCMSCATIEHALYLLCFDLEDKTYRQLFSYRGTNDAHLLLTRLTEMVLRNEEHRKGFMEFMDVVLHRKTHADINFRARKETHARNHFPSPRCSTFADALYIGAEFHNRRNTLTDLVS